MIENIVRVFLSVTYSPWFFLIVAVVAVILWIGIKETKKMNENERIILMDQRYVDQYDGEDYIPRNSQQQVKRLPPGNRPEIQQRMQSMRRDENTDEERSSRNDRMAGHPPMQRMAPQQQQQRMKPPVQNQRRPIREGEEDVQDMPASRFSSRPSEEDYAYPSHVKKVYGTPMADGQFVPQFPAKKSPFGGKQQTPPIQKQQSYKGQPYAASVQHSHISIGLDEVIHLFSLGWKALNVVRGYIMWLLVLIAFLYTIAQVGGFIPQ